MLSFVCFYQCFYVIPDGEIPWKNSETRTHEWVNEMSMKEAIYENMRVSILVIKRMKRDNFSEANYTGKKKYETKSSRRAWTWVYRMR